MVTAPSKTIDRTSQEKPAPVGQSEDLARQARTWIVKPAEPVTTESKPVPRSSPVNSVLYRWD
jgi:hypothetical protein